MYCKTCYGPLTPPPQFQPATPSQRPCLRTLHRPRTLRCAAGKDGEQNIDVAVFRFTLGIPGFDDSNIPRVAGILSLALLLLNHTLSSTEPGVTSTEVVGAFLSAIAIVAPHLERKLKELEPGRGRAPVNPNVLGGDNVFAIATDLGNKPATQELAWASYTLLKNANICGLFVVWRNAVVLCRGILSSDLILNDGNDAPTLSKPLERATRAWCNALPALPPVISHETRLYGDRRELEATGAFFSALSPLVPAGAQSLALFPLGAPLGLLEQPMQQPGEGGKRVTDFLVLVSDRERSLSPKEVAWAEGVAAALYSKLLKVDD